MTDHGTGTLRAVVVLTLLGGPAHAAEEALWRELDIIPMPREIALTGRDLPLAGAVGVLGPRPSAQDTIGAQWLSDECVAHGGAAIPAVTPDRAADAPLRIIVGTRASNPLIAAAAQAGQIDVGPDNPGERGYVIATRPAGAATELLLAGADEIGALYACVTLGELFRDGAAGPTVREASTRRKRARSWKSAASVGMMLLSSPVRAGERHSRARFTPQRPSGVAPPRSLSGTRTSRSQRPSARAAATSMPAAFQAGSRLICTTPAASGRAEQS